MASSDVNSKISSLKASKDNLKSKRKLFKHPEKVPERDKADHLCAVATNETTKCIPKPKSVAVSRGKIPKATFKQIADSKTFGFEAQPRRVAVEEPAINDNESDDAAQSKENCDRNVDLGKPSCAFKHRQLKPPSYSLKNASKEVMKLLQREKLQQSPDKYLPGSNRTPEKIIRGNCCKEGPSSLDDKFPTLLRSELSALREECLTSTPLRAVPNANQELPIQVVSPKRYVDHAGLLFRPKPTKTTTTKPFNFDPKSRGKRRSKTTPAPDSPLLSKGKKSSMDDSKIPARNGIMESHIRRLKKPEVKKLLPLAENQSTDAKKTAANEMPIATKTVTAHAGLTFKPKPLTKSNTFTIKPGESKVLEELKRRNPQLCGNT